MDIGTDTRPHHSPLTTHHSPLVRLWAAGMGGLLLVIGLVLAGQGWPGVASAAPTLPLSGGAGAGHGATAPLDCPAWQVVASPNAGTEDNVLESASAVSASDVWAAGYY